MDYVTGTEGRKVAVHCHAGLGRTGLAIACFFLYSQHYTSRYPHSGQAMQGTGPAATAVSALHGGRSEHMPPVQQGVACDNAQRSKAQPTTMVHMSDRHNEHGMRTGAEVLLGGMSSGTLYLWCSSCAHVQAGS
jgi:hypothetical protein